MKKLTLLFAFSFAFLVACTSGDAKHEDAKTDATKEAAQGAVDATKEAAQGAVDATKEAAAKVSQGAADAADKAKDAMKKEGGH